jgi:hypothetical protein
MRTDTSGTIYVKADLAAADTARRFETTAKLLLKAYITVATQSQSFGTSASQVFPVAANGTIYLENVDISTLYFKNTTGGQNGTVSILGVLA